LGAGGRGFESRHPDGYFFECVVSNLKQARLVGCWCLMPVSVAQRLRTLAPTLCRDKAPPSCRTSVHVIAGRSRSECNGAASAVRMACCCVSMRCGRRSHLSADDSGPCRPFWFDCHADERAAHLGSGAAVARGVHSVGGMTAAPRAREYLSTSAPDGRRADRHTLAASCSERQAVTPVRGRLVSPL
jgi:hypothetical protein